MTKTRVHTLMAILILMIGAAPSVLANPLPVYQVQWMDLIERSYYKPICTKLIVDTQGSTKIAAYGVKITYDPTLIRPLINQIEAGEGGFLTAANIVAPGELIISGFDTEGRKDMVLFNVYWDPQNSYGGLIDMEIDQLVDEDANPIPYSVNRKTATLIAGKMPGDVNGDYLVNIVDALLTALAYVANLDPADFDPSVADVNCDDRIDIVDALRIAQFYVQAITSLDCP